VIGFVSGHGTATEWGDIAESAATTAVLGLHVPIHSLKGHFGHSLGACGAIEAWLAIEMMREDLFWPTANLEHVDPRCAELDYVMMTARALQVDYLMSNNFASAGSIRRWCSDGPEFCEAIRIWRGGHGQASVCRR
jgi:3-oxoacyl-[acyl-carrier-protein] synthase II